MEKQSCQKDIKCIKLFCYFFPFGAENLNPKARKIPLKLKSSPLYMPRKKGWLNKNWNSFFNTFPSKFILPKIFYFFVIFFSHSGPQFPVFELNTRKYGPEITLHLDTFHVVFSYRIVFVKLLSVANKFT